MPARSGLAGFPRPGCRIDDESNEVNLLRQRSTRHLGGNGKEGTLGESGGGWLNQPVADDVSSIPAETQKTQP